MDLSNVHCDDAADLVARVLGVARRQFGMEMAWMSLFADTEHVVEVVDRAASSSCPLQAGDRGRFADSYCVRVLRGDLPQLIRDTSANPTTRALSITRELGIGSYVGAPITDHDGRPLGMICCVDRGTADHLDDDSPRILDLIALLVGELLTGESPSDQRDREVRNRVMLCIAERRHRCLFQPIVSLDSGRVIGVEALARFDGPPDRPDVWFAQAHSVGLGVELELATLSAALQHLDELPPEMYLAVNASPAALNDPRLARRIGRSQPSRIVVEITEHAAIENYAELIRSLQALRAMGVRIAVDDVGAGFSSFAHVLELSPHLLKMDLSISRGIDSDPARRALATAIVEVGRRLGAGIVAEGIETEAELRSASAIGISSVQGHLLGRPQTLPLPELTVPMPAKTDSRSAHDHGEGELTSRQFELAMRHSPIGICLVGLDGLFLHVNPALAAMLGYSPTELVELTFQQLTHPADLDIDLHHLVQCLEGSRNSYRLEKRYLHADGSIVWGDLSVVLVRDGAGAPRYFVSQIVDVTERHRREETLAAQALTDHLTGLSNRAAIEEHMEHLAAAGRPFGVLFCDLRGFKAVNDAHGHAAGDAVLTTVAARLSAGVRDADMVARWGGDEFVVVLPDVEPAVLAATAGRLAAACDRPIELDGRDRLDSVRVTIGLASHSSNDPATVQETVHRADIDMYSRRADLGVLTAPRPGVVHADGR